MLRRSIRPVLLPSLLLALLPTVLLAQDDAQLTEEAVAGSEAQTADHWVDTGHAALTESAGDLARWMDQFFGEAQSDIESASSRLRVRLEHEWDQDKGNDFQVKLRGKLNLPAASRRLSIVFEDEDSGSAESFESAGFSTDESRSVALQLNILDRLRQRIDLSVGAKSGPKGKLAARFRNEYPLGEQLLTRFSEELFWIGGDGFGTLTRFDIDHTPREDRLLRWSNRLLYAEESNGVEWSTRLGFRQRLDDKSAGRIYIGMNGDTDPRFAERAYTVGLAYRRNIFRPWLFFELEPKYEWRKDLLDDGSDGPRHGVAVVLFRFEIALEEHRHRESGVESD